MIVNPVSETIIDHWRKLLRGNKIRVFSHTLVCTTPDVVPMPALGIAFATTSCKAKGKKTSGRTKYISNSNWKATSPEAQTKVINTCKNAAEDDDNEKSSAGMRSAKTMKSISKTIKSLEMDNRRLKKSVSALQKCKEDDDNDSSISSAEGSSHF